MINALESSSTRPYLIRALYEWCTDNGFTPYVAVLVDDTVQVPREYVKNGEIVLNISFDATSSLKLGNEFIEFKARFAGSAREIVVPIGTALEEIERMVIRETLRATQGDKRLTAQLLGIATRTIYRKLAEERGAGDGDEEPEA